MPGERPASPELIEEVEALLGTSFFPEEEYTSELPEGTELGYKEFVYNAALRLFAQVRRDDRLQALAEPNYNAKTWTEEWRVTLRQVAEVAFRHTQEATFLSRQLALINKAADYVDQSWEELTKDLYPDQQAYIIDIVNSLQKEPRRVAYCENNTVDTTSVAGVTVLSPTGSGKSHLMKATAAILGVGQPLEYTIKGEAPVRGVFVAPSHIIQGQLTRMFREAFPECTVGRLSDKYFEPDADFVITTIPMFVKHFRDNRIAGKPVDVVMIDEVHHLTAPEFKNTFLTQWDGITVGFTATAAYDLERDVRNIIPHVVDRESVITLIESGRLNDGQIFTFLIDDIAYDMLRDRYGLSKDNIKTQAIIREVVDTFVMEFVTPLLEEGRRGIIFCEQGAKAYYANRLAERLNTEVTLSNGQTITAAAMSSYANNQERVVADYKAGKVNIITTVNTGREGLDADFDFVIINCNIVSRLRGHQITGRGPRPSERFPVTTYAQFSTHKLSEKAYERFYSIEETFSGADRVIRPGRTIRESLAAERTRLQNDEEGNKSSLPSSTRKKIPPGGIDISEFPDIVQDLLKRVSCNSIGEAFTGVERGKWAVQEGMLPLEEILEGFDTSPLLARKLLRKAGYAWRGRYEKTADGQTRLAYYYTPEARDYLRDILPKGRMLSEFELAGYFNASVTLIREIIEEKEITGRMVVRGKGRPPTCYDEDAIRTIGNALKEIPGTQPGDTTARNLARELDTDVQVILKVAGLHNEKRRLIGKAFPLTAAEAEAVRKEFAAIPMATPGEVTLSRIAEIVGTNRPVVDRNLSDELRTHGTLKRYYDKSGKHTKGIVWPPHIALQIVESMRKFKSEKLPAHLLPITLARKLVSPLSNVPRKELFDLLERGEFKPEEMIITGTNSFSVCLSWPAIAYLREVLQKKVTKRTMNVDFSRLPAGPDDLDPDKIAYAQSLQQGFLMKPHQLKDY